jgi:hypothetical protein
MLIPRNVRTLLQGVPTNAQLALTLLRLAESTSNPFHFHFHQHNQRQDKSLALIRHEDLSLTSALLQALRPKPAPLTLITTNDFNSTSPLSPTDTDSLNTHPPKSQKLHKFFRFARRAIKTAVRGHIALDHALATTASTYARRGLQGVLDANNGRIGGIQTGRLLELLLPSSSVSGIGKRNGNVVFEAKFEKKRGCVVLDFDTDVDSVPDRDTDSDRSQRGAVLYFTTTKLSKIQDTRLSRQKSSNVKFSIPLGNITEIQKTAGLGWKGKLIIELAVGNDEIDAGSADGLVVRGVKTNDGDTRGTSEGEGEGEGGGVDVGDGDREKLEYHLTGVMGRDALFNRLIAGGEQVWEMC